MTIGPNDYPQWGKLVKSWATGRNYVDYQGSEENPVPTAPDNKFQKPRSFEEFWDQCQWAQVDLFFDDANNTPVRRDVGIGLIVLQGDSDVFVLRLPPQEILLEHEARFLKGSTYQLPDFYAKIPELMTTKVGRMTIHAERVGEYTLNTCG
ncbi:hypothetical protein [Bradyrhizobium sp.]|uniref:hypothetical protein n=1 Tax=Bradyrhizobium sp. TaxID=376 RepID=UPI001D6EB709|nr:hypothetical protein [Bradyrhizobium sp.]MBV8697035.1 hypothetical protein [Bradyrhizobium sp.]MBV8917675.1 hypothetical protein [Bradyrhizobium sp.]MBV9980378.1 hypothetical protein [Bradyrhizobium sp.]